MSDMKDPRNFWDKLFRRKEKTVYSRDEQGKVTGATIYTFDSHGGIVGQKDFVTDPNGKLNVKKDKTFIRRKDGTYDPDKTYYFDDQGRVETEHDYYRGMDDVLEASRSRYIYIQGVQHEASHSVHIRVDDDWYPLSRKTKEYDDQGHRIRSDEWKSHDGKMIPVASRTYTQNDEGRTDPKETTYFDEEGRVTTKKVYFRQKTQINDKPLLFRSETTYDYSEGKQQISNHTISWTFNPRMGGWLSMADLEKLTEEIRKPKAEKAQESESNSSESKSESRPGSTDTQRLAALRRGLDPNS